MTRAEILMWLPAGLPRPAWQTDSASIPAIATFLPPRPGFYETEVVPKDEIAGLIIATASHNPPEWQGIKFNPRLGYPAPTNVTDFIAFRINELQLVDETGGQSDVEEARARGLVQSFDPPGRLCQLDQE